MAKQNIGFYSVSKLQYTHKTYRKLYYERNQLIFYTSENGAKIIYVDPGCSHGSVGQGWKFDRDNAKDAWMHAKRSLRVGVGWD